MQAVLNSPMAMFSLVELTSPVAQAGNKIALLRFHFIVHPAFGKGHSQDFHAISLLQVTDLGQKFGIRNRPALPNLNPSMILIDRCGVMLGRAFKVIHPIPCKLIWNILIQMSLVFFDAKNALSILSNDRLSNLGLHPHCINGEMRLLA
jgi:hypothetical protein